jgi:C-terminal processing protease CtpA/Prc
MATCFIRGIDNELENDTSRLDVHYFDPEYTNIIKELQKLSGDKMKLSPLEELLANSKTKLTGGATPKGAAYLPDGVKFVRVQNVKEFRLDLDNVVFIPKVIHETSLKRSKLKPKDVILTITGVTYGISAVVPDNIGEVT